MEKKKSEENGSRYIGADIDLADQEKVDPKLVKGWVRQENNDPRSDNKPEY